VVGHEDRGCSPTTLAACDAVAFIPLLGKVGSLNVATATGIACYELRRQAWATTAGMPEPTAAPLP
jgi:tRNA (guanosine-2'-O-)-methyltransferase